MQMSDYVTTPHLIANLSQHNDSQHFYFGNSRGHDQSEDFLLGMIREDGDMTPNNVISNRMGASNLDVNRDAVGTGAQTTKLNKAGKNKKGRGKNKVNFGSNGAVKLVFNSFGQPIAPAKSVAKFSRFIGSIAREPSMFPINVSDFRKFKKTGRLETAWEDIKVICAIY